MRRSHQSPRPLLPFLLSLALHLLFVLALAHIRWPVRPARAMRVSQWPAGPRARLIWYDFRKPAPDIAPAKPRIAKPVRVRNASEATVITQEARKSKADTLTWQADQPQKPPPQPRKLANLLVVEPPKRRIEPPPLLAEPPKLDTTAATPATAPIARTATPPPPVREFVMPKAEGAGTAAALPEAPQVRAAVIDLNPGEIVALPGGTQQANISAGRYAKGERGGTPGGGIPVEGLDLSLHAPAQGQTGGTEGARAQNRFVAATYYATQEAIAQRRSIRSLPQEAGKIAPEIRAIFQGRPVYLAMMPQPNAHQYSGDWSLWFSEVTPLPGNDPRVQPPVPFRLVDPISERSLIEAAMRGRMRVTAVIRKTGFVDNVRVLAGLDGLADAAVKEALRRCTFQPALRSGIMVDVDVLLDIPIDLHVSRGATGSN